MILGLILGVGIGINLGIWLAVSLYESVNKDLINDYKKSVDYWFNEYMDERKRHHDFYSKYLNELIDRIGK